MECGALDRLRRVGVACSLLNLHQRTLAREDVDAFADATPLEVRRCLIQEEVVPNCLTHHWRRAPRRLVGDARSHWIPLYSISIFSILHACSRLSNVVPAHLYNGGKSTHQSEGGASPLQLATRVLAVREPAPASKPTMWCGPMPTSKMRGHESPFIEQTRNAGGRKTRSMAGNGRRGNSLSPLASRVCKNDKTRRTAAPAPWPPTHPTLFRTQRLPRFTSACPFFCVCSRVTSHLVGCTC